MPIGAIIGLLIEYGPNAIALLSALQPAFKAAEPVIKKLVSDGMSETDAHAKVFGWWAAPHTMTAEDEAFWSTHSIDSGI
jgi:hypothetical protein